VLDTGEEALVRLGKAREQGFVESLHKINGSHLHKMMSKDETGSQPLLPGSSSLAAWEQPKRTELHDLKKHRMKTAFRFHELDQTRGPDDYGQGWLG
jgi:hypothetical protein